MTVSGTGDYTGSKAVSFTIAQKDIGELIQLGVTDAQFADGVYRILYNENSHGITVSLEGMDGIAVVLNITSVQEVGEYKIKAQISADNYCGQREFTVLVYQDTDEIEPPIEPGKPSGGDSWQNVVYIVIGVVVGVAVIGAAGGLIWYFVRRRNKRV